MKRAYLRPCKHGSLWPAHQSASPIPVLAVRLSPLVGDTILVPTEVRVVAEFPRNEHVEEGERHTQQNAETSDRQVENPQEWVPGAERVRRGDVNALSSVVALRGKVCTSC